MINEYLYIEILRNMPIVTVDLIILDKKKENLLLFNRLNEPMKNIFYTPGGRVYKNETLDNAILRKTQEELCLSLSINDVKFLGHVEEFFTNSAFDNVSSHCINFIYQYILDSPILKLDLQHSEHKWFNINDVTLHKNIKDKIKLI